MRPKRACLVSFPASFRFLCRKAMLRDYAGHIGETIIPAHWLSVSKKLTCRQKPAANLDGLMVDPTVHDATSNHFIR